MSKKTAKDGHKPPLTEPQKNQIGVRLKWARDRMGWSQQDLAERIGVTQAAIDLAERGVTVKPKWLPEAANEMDVDYTWLSGKGGFDLMLKRTLFKAPSCDVSYGTEIAELDVAAAAGHGTLVDGETPIGIWNLPSEMLGQPARHSEALRMIQVVGDSMAPELLPGDRIIVNTADCSPTPPGVFVIFDGIGLMVKRLQLIPAGQGAQVIRISSCNDAYDSFDLDPQECQIRGRVILKLQRL